MKYEYGVAFKDIPAGQREGLTEEQADEWLKDWINDGGNPETFVKIRRQVTEWEICE